MPRFIIKLHDEKFNKDYYLEWSTVCDAPITYGCSLEEFEEYYRAEYGRVGYSDLEERLKRVEEKGISAHPPYDDLQSLFEYNRAGDGETHLDKEGLLEKYCRNQPQIPTP
jgi:hypothetical protein